MIPDLETHLGKHINAFCENGFTSDHSGHSAHYVSHALGLEFSFNCKELTGGRKPGANLRIHEIFSECPKVGRWQDADTSGTLLIFITRASNIDLENKKMINHPQKGIGIFQNGMVYHYSREEKQVVKQDVDSFFETFNRQFDGDQALFYGMIPGSDLQLKIDFEEEKPVPGIKFLVQERNGVYWGSVSGEEGQEFYVGHSLRYGRRQGLGHRASSYYGPKYQGTDFAGQFDHWAFVLEAIGEGESENHFNVINCYDRAAFTFGFIQLAAHTANDNLILFFRKILQLPEAKDYFPELELINGRVHRINENGSFSDLERPDNRMGLPNFMTYLNPDDSRVDEQEMLHAARLIHWSNTHASLRQAQVETSFEITSGKAFQRYHKWYGLEGAADILVVILCDIHHNGRATKRHVLDALAAPDPIAALLTINHAHHRTRNETLKRKIEKLREEGILGTRLYDPVSNGFVAGNLGEV